MNNMSPGWPKYCNAYIYFPRILRWKQIKMQFSKRRASRLLLMMLSKHNGNICAISSYIYTHFITSEFFFFISRARSDPFAQKLCPQTYAPFGNRERNSIDQSIQADFSALCPYSFIRFAETKNRNRGYRESSNDWSLRRYSNV